jgi:very-short-patch-repair endonuclease
MSSPSPLAGEGKPARSDGREREVTRALPPSPPGGEGQLSPSDSRVRARRKLLQDRAKTMRHEPTAAERALWHLLRDRRLEGFKFRRQRTIAPYIVDFVCLDHGLIVEVDGGQHSESDYDERRDAVLKAQGFRVLRFWNNDVLQNSDGVFDTIYAALTSPHPSAALRLPPSPGSGEGLGETHG